MGDRRRGRITRLDMVLFAAALVFLALWGAAQAWPVNPGLMVLGLAGAALAFRKRDHIMAALGGFFFVSIAASSEWPFGLIPAAVGGLFVAVAVRVWSQRRSQQTGGR